MNTMERKPHGAQAEVSRYLCSELVTLRHGDAEGVVNLEEIWSEGAVVEADEAVEAGARVELECGDRRFMATVSGAERHEFGCRIELAFDDGMRWSRELYEPGHLMNPADLPQADGSGAGA